MTDNLKEREAFEAWFNKHHTGNDLARDGDDYEDFSFTQRLWMGWQGRAALAQAQSCVPAGWKLVPDWKGYALLGTGHYVINHTADFDEELGAELLITLATEDDKSGNRQIGESRDVTDQKMIESDQMVIRIGFLNERGLFALEDQLRYIRQLHFAASQQPVQTSEPATWNSPEDTASAQGLVWLRENGVVFLGYHFEQPFREYRDNDGFYVGQQDAESYWARHEDAEPCHPDGWCPLLPPLPTAQAKPEQAAQPLTPAQRRALIDEAGDKTDGLNQDDFADEIVRAVERHHGIAAPQPKD